MMHDRLAVGIDVCKARFDVFIHPADARFSCPAAPDGLDDLVGVAPHAHQSGASS